jgi:hypothetical protein
MRLVCRPHLAGQAREGALSCVRRSCMRTLNLGIALVIAASATSCAEPGVYDSTCFFAIGTPLQASWCQTGSAGSAWCVSTTRRAILSASTLRVDRSCPWTRPRHAFRPRPTPAMASIPVSALARSNSPTQPRGSTSSTTILLTTAAWQWSARRRERHSSGEASSGRARARSRIPHRGAGPRASSRAATRAPRPAAPRSTSASRNGSTLTRCAQVNGRGVGRQPLSTAIDGHGELRGHARHALPTHRGTLRSQRAPSGWCSSSRVPSVCCRLHEPSTAATTTTRRRSCPRWTPSLAASASAPRSRPSSRRARACGRRHAACSARARARWTCRRPSRRRAPWSLRWAS